MQRLVLAALLVTPLGCTSARTEQAMYDPPPERVVVPPVVSVACDMDNDRDGTMHEALRVQLAAPGLQPLEIVSNDERGVVAPIPARLLQLDADHACLVGLSSPGAGMDRCHVLSLVLTHDRIALAQELVYTTERGKPEIVQSEEHHDLFGVVVPLETQLKEDEWELSIGKRTFSLAELRRLSPCQTCTDGLRIYPRPVGGYRPTRLAILWYVVTARGTFTTVPYQPSLNTPGGKLTAAASSRQP